MATTEAGGIVTATVCAIYLHFTSARCHCVLRKRFTGPYLDRDGSPMASGGGTVILSGNMRWYGPGGESVLQQKASDLMVFHVYDGSSGKPLIADFNYGLEGRLAGNRIGRRSQSTHK